MKQSKPVGANVEAGSPQKNDPIEAAVLWFSRIYLGGIPPTMTDDSAFLSFISILTAIEALAGYRYSDVKGSGDRFKRFIAHSDDVDQSIRFDADQIGAKRRKALSV